MNQRWALVVLLLAAPACPATTAVDGGLSGAAIDACASWAAAVCNEISVCSQGHELTEAYGPTSTGTAICAKRQQSLCEAELLASGDSRTVASVNGCAQARSGESCSDFVLGNDPSPCLSMPGQVTAGFPCAFSSQCASAYCGIPPGAVCGLCVPLPDAGASCASTGCGPGLVCGAVSGSCLIPVADGGACAEPNACAPDLECVGLVGDGGTATCRPPGVIAGAICDYRERTAPACSTRLGLECVRENCATISYLDPGARCGSPDGGGPGCPVGQSACTVVGPLQCNSGGVCIQHGGNVACLAPAGDGEPCSLVSGPGCLAPSVCIAIADGGSVCQFPSGSSCD